MSSRWWLWCAFLIVAAGLLSYRSHQLNVIRRDVALQTETANTARQESMRQYLAAQKDGRKLISLLKRLPDTNSALREMIIARAFELNPESRDIALLASYYSPEAKKQLEKIDPLYKK